MKIFENISCHFSENIYNDGVGETFNKNFMKMEKENTEIDIDLFCHNEEYMFSVVYDGVDYNANVSFNDGSWDEATVERADGHIPDDDIVATITDLIKSQWQTLVGKRD